MEVLNRLLFDIEQLARPEHAEILSRFFKTGPGQYGDGDLFLGVKVPPLRSCAVRYARLLTLSEMEWLLNRPEHELRLVALLMLVYRYERASCADQGREIVDLYLRNSTRINNWDLVDLSAYKILGPHCASVGPELLYTLAGSGFLWEERMSIIATLHFIRNRKFDVTLNISRSLMHHKHDLIHKAVGWMIREVGKRDFDSAFSFVREHYKVMPRTMLRYAIERYPEEVRRELMR